MKRERRSLQSEMRAYEEGGEYLCDLRVLTYNVVDSYGSLWMPGCFDESLARRLPTFAWSHNWNEPIGRARDYELEDEGPRIQFYFDDFESVPTAKRAYAQVKSGTIDDCSVGFANVERRSPTDEEEKQYPGIREVITKADLDEVSLVLAGAVPGAKVLAVRSDEVVPANVASQAMAQLANGEIDLHQALGVVKEAAFEEPDKPKDKPEDKDNDKGGDDADNNGDSEGADAEGKEGETPEEGETPDPKEAEITDAEIQESVSKALGAVAVE